MQRFKEHDNVSRRINVMQIVTKSPYMFMLFTSFDDYVCITLKKQKIF